MDIIWVILIAAVTLLIGIAGGYYYKKYQYEQLQKEQHRKAESVLQVAQEKALNLEMRAKDDAIKVLQSAESEVARRRAELSREEDRLVKRRAELDHRIERLEQREQVINKRQSALDKRVNEVDKIYSQKMEELQKVAEMSIDEARSVLLAEVEKDARTDMARIIRQIEAEARETGESRARELIADAIQRVASDHVAEVATSVVPLPNEEMKGRIVGRNGRNIRAFEQAAGVDVIVDDTPEAVTISCFDPVRCLG
jgi:ribonuclease Y